MKINNKFNKQMALYLRLTQGTFLLLGKWAERLSLDLMFCCYLINSKDQGQSDKGVRFVLLS